MSLCIVSAFLDIGRKDWKSFQRSNEQYMNNFLPYTKMNYEMIVFIDDIHIRRLKLLCKNAQHIKLIPINRQWMHANIHAWSTLERETEIMQSQTFQSLVSHRLHHPECSKPEYNIMQHAKIDFVCYVIQNKLSQAKYFAWSDFGYFQVADRIPKAPLNISKFDLTRVNFQGMNDLNPQDEDIMYTLTQAPERVGGFFYLGTPELLQRYQKLYHAVCQEFHDRGIVDDDQHIMIQCTFREPALFRVWNLHGWHLVYKHFI